MDRQPVPKFVYQRNNESECIWYLMKEEREGEGKGKERGKEKPEEKKEKEKEKI